MSEDQKDRYIRYLAEQNQEHVLTEKAMESVLEDFMAKQRLLEERMSSHESQQESFESRYESLKSELAEERKLRKAAERKAQTLRSKLDYANQQLFGDKRQKVRKKHGSDEIESPDSDRRGEKDDFDGTDDTLRTDSVGTTHPVDTPLSLKKKRDLSGRPDAYKSMGIMSDGYNAYVFIGNELKSARFKDTIHQVCMSHSCNKFVKAANHGGDPGAELFVNDMRLLFGEERDYDKAGLTSEERLRERQSFATKEIVIRIRSRLDYELSRNPEYRSHYYTAALNYLDHFWDEIFAYLQDGDLPIDNNLAERTIRKLTTQRNSSLHYGSDAGVEMAAAYHSVISTVKLHGSSVWNFIGTFFTKIFNGCRDYVNMTPDRIHLATSQC